MKINQETIDILKNYANINESIAVKAGNKLVTASKKSILANATVKDIFPVDFAIYKLPKLFGAVSLLKDPDFEFGEKEVIIRSGKHSISLLYCDLNMFVLPEKDHIDFPYITHFKLSADSLKKILKAADILDVATIIVEGKKNAVSIKAANAKQLMSDTFTVEVEESVSENFRLVLLKERVGILMMQDYTVSIASRAIRFSTENMNYWIAAESE